MRIVAALLLGILWQSTPGASVDVSVQPMASHVAVAPQRSLCLALMPHRRSPAAPHSGDLAIESALDQEEVSDPDPLEPCSFPYTYPRLTSRRQAQTWVHSKVSTLECCKRLPVLRC
jgi:hypothetical protein